MAHKIIITLEEVEGPDVRMSIGTEFEKNENGTVIFNTPIFLYGHTIRRLWETGALAGLVPLATDDIREKFMPVNENSKQVSG